MPDAVLLHASRVHACNCSKFGCAACSVRPVPVMQLATLDSADLHCQGSCTNVVSLSAGLVGRAMEAFQSVGWFGYFAFPTSARPWQNQILYDWSDRCPINIQDNWACGILYAIIGYQVRLRVTKAHCQLCHVC